MSSFVSATDLDTVARTLRITQHQGGAKELWVPHIEQQRYWQEQEHHRFIYVAKPRQVGISTAVNLADVLETILQDESGHVWRCAIVVDTHEKALERIRVCADFCAQLEVQHVATTERIVFPGGSEIVAWSAGSSGIGRSYTVQRYHLTELPDWEHGADVYGDLMQSLVLGGRCVVETTLKVKEPFARDLWRNKNEYRKVFLPFELHRDYRRDPTGMPDAWWEMCQAEGFTRRDSAAEWLWLLENKCAGDMLKLMREYPQREEHMFQADAARFIRNTPRVSDPVTVWGVPGGGGDDLKVGVWRTPEEGSGQYVMGVDTAAGKEQDRSAIVVSDRRDSRLCALYLSDTVMTDDLARVALDLHHRYSTTDHRGMRFPCQVLIEDNGIGEATCQSAMRLGLPFDRVTTTEDSRYQGLLAAKRAVESGVLDGPAELAVECDALHRDEFGRFKGRKDILMAYGFCALRMRDVGYHQDPPPDEQRIRHKRRLMLEQMRARARQ